MNGTLFENGEEKAKISNFKRFKGKMRYQMGAPVGKDSDVVTFNTDKPIATKPFTEYTVTLSNGESLSIAIKNVQTGRAVEALVNPSGSL